MRILESALVPRSPTEPCADRLVLGEHVAGVADGATAKPWDAPGAPTGTQLAETLSVMLSAIGPDADAATTVEAATALVADQLGHRTGSAVSFCLVHTPSRQIWRVGEARVLVDRQSWPPRPTGESVVAAARALVLRAELNDGTSRDRLAADDPGRAAVQGLLHALVRMRNVADARCGTAAIDGKPVPEAFVEVRTLPASRCEIVVTTDGYPAAAPTLAEAEQALAERLERDPLMIEDPPETKGLRPGANSFDDRAYLRLELDY